MLRKMINLQLVEKAAIRYGFSLGPTHSSNSFEFYLNAHLLSEWADF